MKVPDNAEQLTLWDCGCATWTEPRRKAFCLRPCDPKRQCNVQKAVQEVTQERGMPIVMTQENP